MVRMHVGDEHNIHLVRCNAGGLQPHWKEPEGRSHAVRRARVDENGMTAEPDKVSIDRDPALS